MQNRDISLLTIDSPTSGFPQRVARWAFLWFSLLGLFIASLSVGVIGSAEANEVKSWEYSPYDIQIWVHFSPRVSESQLVRDWFFEQLENRLHSVFRSAWNTRLHPLPFHLAGNLRTGLKSLTVEDLSQNDFALAVSAQHPESRIIRTPQAAVEQLESIHISSATHDSLLISASQFPSDEDSWINLLINRLQKEQESEEILLEKLTSGEIAAALVLRSQLLESAEEIRVLAPPIPWQADVVFNEYDKLFFVWIDYTEDRYRIEACEIDCPTLWVGPVGEGFASNWQQTAHHTAFLIQNAFAPTAKVENAEANSAILLHRAGGLILEEEDLNPARIRVGDVLQPIIRRDDRNGIPTLLQPLKFTFAAVTESDDTKLTANVYTYSGGPGLRGRQNPRTQRYLLRVRPQSTESKLQLAVRGNPDQVQTGCAVYDREHLSEEFRLIGRTDWRGKISVSVPPEPIFILPAQVQAERSAQIRQAKQEARQQALKEYEEALRQAEEDGTRPPEIPVAPVEDIELSVEDSDQIALNSPLLMLYIRSGEQVIARLPFVPGMNPIEVAELPDDYLRLQAEAFVRGFQGEILDLIGQRNLLSARVRLHVQNGDLDRANALMTQLRGLKTFTEMNDQLSSIQRSILEQIGANTTRSSQSAIDRMFKASRDMLQKHMQDETIAETARILREATEGRSRTEEVVEEEV